MNVKFRALIVFLFVAIYTASIGVVSSTLNLNDTFEFQSNDEKQNFSALSAKLLANSGLSEKSSAQSFKVSAQNVKVPPFDFFSFQYKTEQFYEREFAQYTNNSSDFFLQCRKNDLIFPFHYFW